jgi:transcriptional regulator with GAF, ATPase, and Fis domain
MPAAKTPDPSIATRDARRLSTLLEISQALSGTLNLKSSMQRVLQILIRHHGVVRGMVTLLREGELHVEAIEGFDDRARAISFKVGEGITGQVVQSGKPIVVPRISKEPGLPEPDAAPCRSRTQRAEFHLRSHRRAADHRRHPRRRSEVQGGTRLRKQRQVLRHRQLDDCAGA